MDVRLYGPLVPTVTIERVEPAQGPVPAGAKFKLRATVEGGTATAYQWQRGGTDIAGATEQTYEATASKDTLGEFTVKATVDGTEVTSAGTTLLLGAAAGTPSTGGGGAAAETPPEFDRVFAIISAIVAVAIAVLIFRDLASEAGKLVKADWLGDSSDNAVAVTVAVPLTIVGGILVLVGAWMAVVEWRGRFAAKAKAKATQDKGLDIKPAEIIAAIGNLKGAALVLVVGALIMFGAAWIAQSAADEAPAPATPATTSTTEGG